MATTALYRLSSNEVNKISIKGQPFTERLTAFLGLLQFGVLTDPTLPDGTDTVDDLGPLRVLGFAKIAEPGVGPNGNVRNATQAEIDAFAAPEIDDDNQLDKVQSQELFETHPQLRKLFIAQSDIILGEFNKLFQQWTDHKALVASAANLNDIKVATAALPNLPQRTLANFKTAMKNRIDKDD